MVDFDPQAWDIYQRGVQEAAANARKPYADKLMQVQALIEKWEREAKALAIEALGDDWGVVACLERCARELRETLNS